MSKRQTCIKYFTYAFLGFAYFYECGMVFQGLYNTLVRRDLFRFYFIYASSGLLRIVSIASLMSNKETFALVREMTSLLKANRLKHVRRGFYRVIIVTILYALVVSALGHNFQRTINLTDLNESLRFHCFGCDTSKEPLWLVNLSNYADLVIHPIFDCTVAFSFSFLYIYSAKLLSELILTVKTDILTSNCTTKDIGRKILSLAIYCKRCNDVYQNVVFGFLSCTFISTCHYTMLLIENIPENDLNKNFYYSALHLREILNFTMCVWYASNVDESAFSCLRALSNLVENCLDNGGDAVKVQLLYDQMKLNNLNFKAGSCFVITKSFLMSFIWMSASYGIIYLQLNPNAMKAIQSLKSY